MFDENHMCRRGKTTRQLPICQDPYIREQVNATARRAYFPYHTVIFDVLHDAIYKRLCQTSKNYTMVVIALWEFQKKLIGDFGLYEIIKALPYILKLENDWNIKESAEENLNHIVDEDFRCERLHCQRVFFCVFFRYVADLTNCPEITQLATFLLEKWSTDMVMPSSISILGTDLVAAYTTRNELSMHAVAESSSYSSSPPLHDETLSSVFRDELLAEMTKNVKLSKYASELSDAFISIYEPKTNALEYLSVSKTIEAQYI